MVGRDGKGYKTDTMLFGAAEVVLLLGLVLLLFWLATPLRRRLERWFAARLASQQKPGAKRVIVLNRRRDGTFKMGDHDG